MSGFRTIRRVDDLGRIVLPVEMRRVMKIDVHDPLEISLSEDGIVLKKYVPCDIFTGSTEDLIEFHGQKVSRESVLALARMAGILP